jgi:hypothetical protein
VFRQLGGLLLCVLAGCAVQPATRAASVAARPLTADCFPSLTPRIGIEYLAPEPGQAGPQATLEGINGERREGPIGGDSGTRRREPAASKHTWQMNTDDFADLDDPVTRETLFFVRDLMGVDRRRIRRDLGTPILMPEAIDLQSPGIDLPSQVAQADEAAEWLDLNGGFLFNRPLQQLMRRLPVIAWFETELREWKSDNVPMSDEYRAAHAEERNFGRLSMRIHVRDPHDPVELTYVKSGVLVGGSQRQGKVGYIMQLHDGLWLEVRTRHEYDTHDWPVRADLGWQASDHTTLHIAVGDDLDFLTTSTVYSLFDSPMDGSPGLVVYAVHLF